MTVPTTPAISDPHVAAWATEREEWLTELRRTALYLELVAMVCLSLLNLSYINAAPPLLTMGITLALLALAGGVHLLSRRSYPAAAGLAVAGSLILTLAMAIGVRIAAAALLLPLITGLTTLLLTRSAGIVVALISSAFLILTPAELLALDPSLRSVTVVLILGTIALLWVTLSPLLLAMRWAWQGYERSRTALEEARDYQVRLSETLEDLTRANEQLTRLNKLAQGLRQVADNERRAKEEFVANVSHELRTPLNMIIGFCEMITQAPAAYGGRLSQTLLADLDVILRNSQHLSGLINDVLDLSQIEAGQMALTKERVSLTEIVQSAVVAVQPLFQSKQLYLHTHVSDDLPEVFCDRMRIREVLLNLLSNAGRFTEEGGVTVKIWREEQQIVVSVADTGPGIPEEAKVRLFQPFQQLDNTIRRRYGGTGLGLSISKSFLELHNGKMWLESQAGLGTIIFFSLPIDPPAPLDYDSALRWFNPYTPYEEPARPRRLPPANVSPRYVVVEEGEALRQLLARYMDEVEVVAYASLEQATADIAETPTQLVLVNAVNVTAALERVAATFKPPYNVPVLVCSLPGATEASDELGVTDYLVKPISREALLGALGRVAHSREVSTVLVVDDEPDALRLFVRMLASAEREYRVLRAYDGRQALELIAAQRPDVILLDLAMPELNGFQFLRLREQDPALQEIPVILISARDPLGHPIVTHTLAFTRSNGFSTRELLDSIRACVAVTGTTPAQ